MFATVGDYVICSRLRQIDALCAIMELENKYDPKVNEQRRVLAPIPRIRANASAETKPLFRSNNSLYFAISEVADESWKLTMPTVSTLGSSKYLNRLCTSNGMCFDAPDPQTLEEANVIPPRARAYVSYAWTERHRHHGRVTSTVSMVLCVDGTSVTYVDNESDRDATTMLLRRISASQFVLHQTQNNEYCVDFNRKYPEWARVTVLTQTISVESGKEAKRDAAIVHTSEVIGNMWHTVFATVQPKTRAILCNINRRSKRRTNS